MRGLRGCTMGAGVPAGCRVSGGAGSARARPAALPPSTRGRGLPRSADSLAQLGPPRWPSGRKRMSGGGGGVRVTPSRRRRRCRRRRGASSCGGGKMAAAIE